MDESWTSRTNTDEDLLRPLVFVGPSLSVKTVRRLAPHADCVAPAQHGDLLQQRSRRRRTIVLLDGYFHSRAPVRHKEILLLLSEGVRVIGASSMGALRAAELEQYGMEGIGVVYEWYRSGFIDSDEEVALLHSPFAPYESHTIPLVNLRWSMAMVPDWLSIGTLATDTVELAKSLHYYDRTWEAIRTELMSAYPRSADEIGRLSTWWLSRGHLIQRKGEDAQLALVAASINNSSFGTENSWPNEWRTEELNEWLWESSNYEFDGEWFTALELLRYQQLVDGDFPRRWGEMILSMEMNLRPSECLSVFADVRSKRAVNHWNLSPDDTPGLIAVLFDRNRPEFLGENTHLFLLGDPLAAVKGFRNSRNFLASMPELGELKLRGCLRENVVRAFLSDAWGVTSDSELRRAARLRGFETVEDAISLCHRVPEVVIYQTCLRKPNTI